MGSGDCLNSRTQLRLAAVAPTALVGISDQGGTSADGLPNASCVWEARGAIKGYLLSNMSSDSFIRKLLRVRI